jgi:hypothetical protein
MPITSEPWREALGNLLHEPAGSFQHRLGDELTTADEDRALGLLVEIVTEDPCDTVEYKIAGEMLHHLMTPEVAS